MVLCTTQLKLAGWTDWEGFNAFLVEVVWRLNQDEQTFLIFDNSPVHRNADNPGENTETPYSPFHKSGYFTSCHSTKNTRQKRDQKSRHTIWKTSAKNSVRSCSKEYEYHNACQMRSVVQIYADVHTTMSKPWKHWRLIVDYVYKHCYWNSLETANNENEYSFAKIILKIFLKFACYFMD